MLLWTIRVVIYLQVREIREKPPVALSRLHFFFGVEVLSVVVDTSSSEPTDCVV